MKIATAYYIIKGEYRGLSVIVENAEQWMAFHPTCIMLSFGPGMVGLKRDKPFGKVAAYCCH